MQKILLVLAFEKGATFLPTQLCTPEGYPERASSVVRLLDFSPPFIHIKHDSVEKDQCETQYQCVSRFSRQARSLWIPAYARMTT